MNPKTVRTWIEEGRLRSIRPGPRTIRVPAEAIDEFEKQQQGETPESLAKQVEEAKEHLETLTRLIERISTAV